MNLLAPAGTVRGALLIPVLLALGACGGDSNLEPAEGPEVEAQSYTLSTNENALNLADPDLALAAALSALSAGLNLQGSDYLDFNLLEGSGDAFCDTGELSQSGGGQPFVIDFVLDTFQCYFDDPAGLETVLDGRLAVLATVGAGGDGEVDLGSGGASFISAVREGSALEFDFVQARGTVLFATPDNATDLSGTNGLRLIIGKAEPQTASDVLVLDRRIEMLVGSESLAFEIDAFRDTDELAVFGPLAIRGFGLDPECNARGRFSVDTTNVVEVGGDTVSDGQLSLSNATSSASVRFTASGGAEVTTSAGGGPTLYTSSQVRTHCGFES